MCYKWELPKPGIRSGSQVNSANKSVQSREKMSNSSKLDHKRLVARETCKYQDQREDDAVCGESPWVGTQALHEEREGPWRWAAGKNSRVSHY